MELISSWQLVLLLFTAFHVSTVSGRSSGAPAEACNTLSPDPMSPHGGRPQTITVPYEINMSVFHDATTGQMLYTPAISYQSKKIARLASVHGRLSQDTS